MSKTTQVGRGRTAVGEVGDPMAGQHRPVESGARRTEHLVGGRWRLERLLGWGAMSEVYAALDETGGLGAVAVKIVRSSDPAVARRLAEEARALRSFRHPNLVRLLAAGTDHGQAYLVTELVNGPTLEARLRQGRLSTARTAALGVGLAGALEYVHDRGVVHRDVKPANILLGSDRVRLADFGIARLLDAATMTLTGTTLGTAAYIAPEQIAHHAVGPAADIWSLAMTLLECLTGRRIFEGAPAEVVAQRLTTGVRLPAGLPTAWRFLLVAMLDPAPTARPGAAEVAGLLSAPVFETSWERPAEPPSPGAAARDEPSRTAPPPGGTELASDWAVWPAPVHPTGTLVADGTMVDRDGLRRREPALSRLRRFGVPLVVSAFIAIALVAWAASGTGPPGRRTRTGTNRPAATTTTVPGVAADVGTLERDVQQGIGTGSISQPLGLQLRISSTR